MVFGKEPATAIAVSCLAASAGVLAFAAPRLIGLLDAIDVLGAVALLFGVWVFLDHGGRRVTAAGLYCLTAGIFIGSACFYYRTADPTPVTRNAIYYAAIWAYLTTVAMYAGWWSRTPRTLSPLRAQVSSGISGYARTAGFALLVVGLGMHYGHIRIGTLDTGATFDGSVMLGASFIFGDSHRRRPALWQTVACGAALGVYVVSQFSGGGRLVLVTLGFALVLLVQDRIRYQHLKLAIVVIIIPTLVLFAAVGRNRNRADPTEQQAAGLKSVVSPLNSFATEIQDGLSNRGPGPLVGDITFAIPRAIWPTKPLSFGQTLASYLAPTVFDVNPNMSLAALNQGEWYYIDGWGGLVIMMLFTGFAVAWLDRRLRLDRDRSRSDAEPKAFLGLVALCIIAAGLPNLAWAGTSTWSGRAVPCLLALVPFWLYAFIAPRRRTRLAVVSTGPAWHTRLDL